MTRFVRIFGLWLLVALIGATSQTMAVSRGHAAAVGQVVLCTGAGLQTIQIDADGNPTKGGHYCPECVLGAWADPKPHSIAAPVHIVTQADTPITATNLIAGTGPFGLGARGPPRFI